MITYKMIEDKIDRLLEQGAVIHVEGRYDGLLIDKISVESDDITIGRTSIDEYIVEENPYMVEYLYKKLDKAFWEQKRLTPEEIVKYLED